MKLMKKANKSIHSDWQKLRRFALHLLPSGDAKRYELQNLNIQIDIQHI